MSNKLSMIGTSLIAVCAGGLGYLVITGDGLQVSSLEQGLLASVPETSPTPSPSLILPAARPDVFYAAITDRPVFAPTRRPQETEVTSAPVEPEPEVPDQRVSWPEGLTLSGVLGGGDDRSALVTAGGGESKWLRIDDSLEGWRVTEIGSEWIVLTAGDDSVRLELFE